MGLRLLYFSVIVGTEYFTVLIIFSKIKNTISSLLRKRWIKRSTPGGTSSFALIMSHNSWLIKDVYFLPKRPVLRLRLSKAPPMYIVVIGLASESKMTPSLGLPDICCNIWIGVSSLIKLDAVCPAGIFHSFHLMLNWWRYGANVVAPVRQPMR